MGTCVPLVQVVNFSKEVIAQLVKGASINLCSNLPGQITMTNIMHPPQVCAPPKTSNPQL